MLDVEDFLEQPEASSSSRKREDGVEAAESSFSPTGVGRDTEGIKDLVFGSLCNLSASGGETVLFSTAGTCSFSDLFSALTEFKTAFVSFLKV